MAPGGRRFGVSARSVRLGLFVLGVGLLPLVVRSPYVLSILIFVGLNTILTVGLCLLMGYAGQVSLGHAGLYGLGAYASAIATARLGLSPWLGMLFAMALAGGVALAIAWPLFKLKGHYLAMATLGFGYIVYIFFTEASGLTGGPSGLTGVPHLALGGLTLSSDVAYYYVVWGAAVAVLLASLNLVHSRVGRALRAIHGSEVAAQAFGVDTGRLKAQIFVLSAVYAGLAGSLYAHYVTFVNPSPFGFHTSVMLVVMAAVGGLATIWGAPLGAAIVTALGEALRAVVPALQNRASGEYEIIAFGLLLMLIMIFMPQGVVQGLSDAYARRRTGEAISSSVANPFGFAASLRRRLRAKD
jgi:branched-chain amino acid transport system permease protein